jgi:hypothetical protein
MAAIMMNSVPYGKHEDGYHPRPFRPQRVLLNEEERENARFFPLLDKEGVRGWLIDFNLHNQGLYPNLGL